MRNSTIRVELPLLKFLGAGGGGGGLVLWISSDGDDWMGAEIKTQKIPRASNKPFLPPQRNHGPKIIPQKFPWLISEPY